MQIVFVLEQIKFSQTIGRIHTAVIERNMLGTMITNAASACRRPLVTLSAYFVGWWHDSTPVEKCLMPTSTVDQSVVVSKEAFESEDAWDITYSNMTFVAALLGEHFTRAELSQNALRSYYVNSYLGEVQNGGFSQFVYNCDWDPDTVRFVREGLQAMEAAKHLELFNQSAAIVNRLGPDDMEKFFESEYLWRERGAGYSQHV